MNEHYFPVKENDLWGFIDISGNIVVKPAYKKVSNVYNGVFFAELPSFQAGLMSIDGNWVLQPQEMLNFENFFEGFAIVRNFQINGICDTKGNIKNFKPYHPLFIREGLICAQHNNLYGYLDFDGKVVIDFKYDSATFFHNSLAQVSLPGTNGWSYINKRGELLIKGPYERAGFYSEGKLSVQIGDKYGYVDENENIVITPSYDYAGTFVDGLAPVKSNDYYGFINHQNQVIIPYQFKIAADFNEGIALVYNDDLKIGFIDKTGKYIAAPQFVEAENFSNGLAKVLFKKVEVSNIEKNPFNLSGDVMKSNPIANALGNQAAVQYLGITYGYYYYMNPEGKIVYPNSIPETVSMKEENAKDTLIPSEIIERKKENIQEEISKNLSNEDRNRAVKQLFAEFVQPFIESKYLVNTPYTWIGALLGFLFGYWIVPANTANIYPAFVVDSNLSFIVAVLLGLLGFGIGSFLRNLSLEAGGFVKMFTPLNLIITFLVILVSYQFHNSDIYTAIPVFFYYKIIELLVFFALGLFAAQTFAFMLKEVARKYQKKMLTTAIVYFILSFLFVLLIVFAKGSSMAHRALLVIYFLISFVFTGIMIFISNATETSQTSHYTFWPLFDKSKFSDNAEKFFTFSIEEIQQYNYLSKYDLKDKLGGFITNRSAVGLFALFYINFILGLLPWVLFQIVTNYRVFD